MAFADEIKLKLKAGDGGNGLTSFRRERYIARGGPDGGDGGKGGSIVLSADHNQNSLSHLLRSKVIKAQNGKAGETQKSTGRSAEDLIVKVPIGTQVFEMDPDSDEECLVGDLNKDGDKLEVAKGGSGGFGNARFARPTFQAPRFAEFGEPGEEKEVILRLKLIAEVGLIGLPNAGKSTLLSVISSAKPKIADYEFTTLEPNLGIVEHQGRRILFADIPGLIEGAHMGKGLGIDFLKHVERTKVLVHILDSLKPDPYEDWQKINNELELYSKALAGKPQVVVFNKIDALDDAKRGELEKINFGTQVFYISAASHKGLDELLSVIHEELDKLPDPEIEEETITIKDLPYSRFEVEKDLDGNFYVTGSKVEKLVIKTDLNNEQALGRMYKVMRRMGVLAELAKKGAEVGDKVTIGGTTIEYRQIA
ncbi:MAG: GTPase ObgE [Patescibacteria group bacterium]|nr:GTPase ObgE [Patescibacteria group bacterium]